MQAPSPLCFLCILSKTEDADSSAVGYHVSRSAGSVMKHRVTGTGPGGDHSLSALRGGQARLVPCLCPAGRRRRLASAPVLPGNLKIQRISGFPVYVCDTS